MSNPVQGSWGGLISFTHNHPYIEGDTAVIKYKSPSGLTGEITPISFDATEIKAVMSEEIFSETGRSWSFQMVVSGTRPEGDFSIPSVLILRNFTESI